MKKKVWVNGCFDILHAGHIGLLAYAKSLGDVYVGIDGDKRIIAMKGAFRPILPQNERRLILSSLIFVKDVKVFNSKEELVRLVKDLSPDYMVVGEEYRFGNVIGSEFAKELLFYPRMGNWSTTNIVAKIKSTVVMD